MLNTKHYQWNLPNVLFPSMFHLFVKEKNHRSIRNIRCDLKTTALKRRVATPGLLLISPENDLCKCQPFLPHAQVVSMEFLSMLSLFPSILLLSLSCDKSSISVEASEVIQNQLSWKGELPPGGHSSYVYLELWICHRHRCKKYWIHAEVMWMWC